MRFGASTFIWESPVGDDKLHLAFAEIGCDGLAVIEPFTPESQEIACAVSTWRPVAGSGEALASEELAFLKQQVAAQA